VIADAAEATTPGIFQGPNGWCNASFTRNLYYNHSGTNTTIGTINTNTANTTIAGTRRGGLVTHSFAGVHTRTFPGYPHTHLNFQTVNASSRAPASSTGAHCMGKTRAACSTWTHFLSPLARW
jgi:hypothetical protein